MTVKGRLELSIEEEVDEGPVSAEGVGPGFERELRDVPLVGVWVLQVGLLLSQVELFVESI